MSQFKETPKITGQLTLTLRDSNGQLIEERTVKNLVVDAGLTYIASRMIGESQDVMSHMAIGTGSTAPAGGQTSLITPSGSRVTLEAIQTDNAVTYSATFGAGVGEGAIQEAGIFNASTSGTMLCRTKFGVINKTSSDSLSINWVITVN